MAQDFFGAFGLGDDSLGINSINEMGVIWLPFTG